MCKKFDFSNDDKQIAACTGIIEAGRETQHDLAVAYFNRAEATTYSSSGPKTLIGLPTAEIFDKALADYGQAIRLDPTNPQFLIGRGRAYDSLTRVPGDRTEDEYRDAASVAYYKAHFSNDPKLEEELKRANADEQEAKTRLENYKADQAIADFTEAIRVAPGSAEAFMERATRYQRNSTNPYLKRQDVDRAIADYTAAIRLDPRNANSFRGRIDAYIDKGDIDRAIADYDELIRLYPRDAEYFKDRGELLNRKRALDRGR